MQILICDLLRRWRSHLMAQAKYLTHDLNYQAFSVFEVTQQLQIVALSRLNKKGVSQWDEVTESPVPAPGGCQESFQSTR